jgi:hypothetical protein
MSDLASRIILPAPGGADRHAYQEREYQIVLQISTDGFAGYPDAIDSAFGPFVGYGQIIKNFDDTPEPGRYAPGEMVNADRRVIRGAIDRFSICTSHVERHNWTVRTFMKRFNRLTCAFSKKLENLEAATALFMAHYNFVWRTRYPDKSGQSGRLRSPAALAAGVTNRLWTFDDLFAALLECV